MQQFSTILFIDGNPFGYEVLTDERNRLSLNPAENPHRELKPPVLTVQNVDGEWKVEGTTNQDLINQVLEEILLNAHLPTHGLSAAP